jgi:phospholipase/carboxylesterase
MTPAAVVALVEALERAFRDAHPPRFPELRRRVSEPLAALEAEAPRADDPLAPAAQSAREAAHLFIDPAPPAETLPRFFACRAAFADAQACLYPRRSDAPELARFFALPEWHDRLAELDPPTPEGVRVGLFRDHDERGFAFYVPERYDARADWPLVVALHGGGGNGREFLWTWLREARSRGFLLLAPSSAGSTWSMTGPDVDAVRLARLLDWLGERWRIDRARMLVTGLSDGATYALLRGLAADSPFSAIAAGAGVLHPANLANGNLVRARGKPVYLVHGALDWLFPVVLARTARDLLRRAGAALTYEELADLSHAWPREENVRILDWYDACTAGGHGGAK